MIERTLVLVKPDGVKRGLIGEIVKRFEQRGLKIVGAKMIRARPELAQKHYTASEPQIVGMGNKTLEAASPEKAQQLFGTIDPKEIGKTLREWLLTFIISTPVVALVLSGENVIQRVRKIAGFTDPQKADMGTIRGDLGIDAISKANEERRATENLVHASGSVEEAKQEIAIWFSEDEIFEYKKLGE